MNKMNKMNKKTTISIGIIIGVLSAITIATPIGIYYTSNKNIGVPIKPRNISQKGQTNQGQHGNWINFNIPFLIYNNNPNYYPWEISHMMDKPNTSWMNSPVLNIYKLKAGQPDGIQSIGSGKVTYNNRTGFFEAQMGVKYGVVSTLHREFISSDLQNDIGIHQPLFLKVAGETEIRIRVNPNLYTIDEFIGSFQQNPLNLVEVNNLPDFKNLNSVNNVSWKLNKIDETKVNITMTPDAFYKGSSYQLVSNPNRDISIVTEISGFKVDNVLTPPIIIPPPIIDNTVTGLKFGSVVGIVSGSIGIMLIIILIMGISVYSVSSRNARSRESQLQTLKLISMSGRLPSGPPVYVKHDVSQQKQIGAPVYAQHAVSQPQQKQIGTPVYVQHDVSQPQQKQTGTPVYVQQAVFQPQQKPIRQVGTPVYAQHAVSRPQQKPIRRVGSSNL